MSTKRPAVRPTDTELPLPVAVALFAAAVLGCWAVVLVVVTTTLVVAGSVGLVLLFVAVGAIWAGVR